MEIRGRGRVAPCGDLPPQLSKELEEKTNSRSLLQCSRSFRCAWGMTLNPNSDSNRQENTACFIYFTPSVCSLRAPILLGHWKCNPGYIVSGLGRRVHHWPCWLLSTRQSLRHPIPCLTLACSPYRTPLGGFGSL